MERENEGDADKVSTKYSYKEAIMHAWMHNIVSKHPLAVEGVNPKSRTLLVENLERSFFKVKSKCSPL